MSWLFPKRLADGDEIVVAGVTVRLKVSGRARRISLRLDMARGEVLAIAPTLRQLNEAAAFAGSRADWITEQFQALPQRQSVRPGDVIEVLGRPHLLRHAPGKPLFRAGAGPEPASLTVGGDPARFGATVVRTLKQEARRALTERTEVHATALGRPMPVVSVTDARSRWGSCRPPRMEGFGAGYEVGRIRYSWRLILAPFDVADYVAAHECAHLIEANHSPRFWAVVRGLVGDHRPYRAWLREHGARLHAFGGEI
ncbi:MAG: SprT family zinc-dependent metalloprotease [Caulobacteraceae bacterium]|nr:SprT family zinc-dependent metalloprotease [Caulobacteraceae bacterium]